MYFHNLPSLARITISLDTISFFLPLMKCHSKALQEEQLAAAAIFFRFLKRDEMTRLKNAGQ